MWYTWSTNRPNGLQWTSGRRPPRLARPRTARVSPDRGYAPVPRPVLNRSDHPSSSGDAAMSERAARTLSQSGSRAIVYEPGTLHSKVEGFLAAIPWIRPQLGDRQ